MKEAIGGISLFNIVIFFIVVFTGYISLSINYSKAYNVKNELLNIIKNQGGICTTNNATSGDICDNFTEQIKDYFQDEGYRSTGNCSAGWVGFSRSGDYLGERARNAAFCIKGINVNTNSELPNALYYQVRVFYQLDLPILNSVFEFAIAGETSRIYDPNECGEGTSYGNLWCREN